MLLFDGALGVIALGVWIFCIIDVITTPSGGCRNLPKMVWLMVVILLVDIGSIAWLVAGRAWVPRPVEGAPDAGRADVPRRGARPVSRPTSPDDDPEFLASLRVRADEEQRRRAREAQLPDEPPGSTPQAG